MKCLAKGMNKQTHVVTHRTERIEKFRFKLALYSELSSLDNDRDNRVAGKRYVVSGADDKIGVCQSSAERCFHERKPRLRFIALLSDDWQ